MDEASALAAQALARKKNPNPGRTGGTGRRPDHISARQYDELRKHWEETHSLAQVAERSGISYKVLRRIASKGLPDLGLPPLIGPDEVRPRPQPRAASSNPRPPLKSGAERLAEVAEVEATREAERLEAEVRQRISDYQAESRKLNAEIDDYRRRGVDEGALKELRAAFDRLAVSDQSLQRVTQEVVAADQTRKSAEEAAAARMTMRTAVTSAAIVGHLAEHILKAIEEGRMELPTELSPRLVGLLAKAADVSSSAVEKAMAIARKREGKPDKVLGISLIVNDCSDEELQYIAETGQLPPRLMSSFAPQIIEAAGERVAAKSVPESSDGDE